MEIRDIHYNQTPPSSMDINTGRCQFAHYYTAQPTRTEASLIIKRRARLNQAEPSTFSKEKDNDVFLKIKKTQLINEFIQRLRLNNTNRSDINYQKIHKKLIEQHLGKEIKELKEYNQSKNLLECLVMLVKITLLISLYVTTSLSYTFGQIKNAYQITIALYFIYFAINSFEIANWTMKMNDQFQKIDLQLIYLKVRNFNIVVDINIWVVGILNLSLRSEGTFIVAISIIISKLITYRSELQQKQIYIIHSQTVSKYWDIVKIVTFNLIAAHTLSIILNLVGTYSQLNHDHNWYSLKGIDLQNWIEKYIWGYYWSISIMFTIGFGDINATNISESMVIIFASIVSCLALSYNISEINRILQRLNIKNEQLKSKLSEFDIITSRYGINPQLKDSIEHHIEQQIKDKFEYDYLKEQKIINELPNKLKHQFKRQINKQLFAHLTFFKDLGKKTQHQIAQNLINKIAFPDSIYMKKNERWKISILRLGEIKLCHQRDNSKLNGVALQKFSVKNGDIGELMSLKFIKNKVLEGNLVASKRSIISQMQVQDFQLSLKNTNPYMHQYYCQIRDRNQQYLFNYGTKGCQLCINMNHSKHDCPKLHFFPLKHFTIYKEITRNGFLQKREQFKRQKETYKVLLNPVFQQLIRESLQYSSIARVFKKNMFKSTNFIEQAGTEQNSETPMVIKRFEKVQKQLNRIISLIKFDQSNNETPIDVDRAFDFNRYHSYYNPSELQKYDFRKGRTSIRENTVKRSMIKAKNNYTTFHSMSSYL